MIGKVIGNYQVVRKIGSGGMGEVYLAHDNSLKRDVALKFLPDHSLGSKDQISRFRREAQAAAALKHPNILTIHEISQTPNGRQFIVMDYYPGRNLLEHLEEGPLSEKTALQIVWAIAQGLASAHAAGIIHRDIKPSNIMVSAENQVKILDFGLAKITNHSSCIDSGTTYGTASYMSPEQAGAQPVDHQTDIWSLGAVFYQLVTGNLPFPGEFSEARIYGILHNEPSPIPAGRCSRKLKAIIKKMLTKNLADRYQHMAEVLDDMGPLVGKTPRVPIRIVPQRRKSRWISAWIVVAALTLAGLFLGPLFTRNEVADPRKSVAALPFENLTGEEQFSIWSLGLPHLILAELSRSPELYVLNPQASETVYSAMGRPATAGLSLGLIQEFATRTQVETLILGSVMKAGNQWRIQVQLQDTQSGTLMASASAAPRSEDHFFAAADSLAEIIRNYLEIRELEGDLSYGQRQYASGTQSSAAYRQFLEAYEAYRKREWSQAKVGFEQALSLDPDYTAVQYMLIWTYRQLEEAQKTRELFDLVQTKRNTLPVIDQYSLDTMGAILDKDHWQAIQSLKKVVDRDPQLRGKWGQLGSLYLSVKEPELALTALEHAMNLTRQWGDQYPWVHLYRNLAQVYVGMGKYDQAVEVARQGLETGEQNRRSMLFWICAANIAKGDREETQKQLANFQEELRSQGIGDIIIRMNVGFIYLKAGHTAEALPQMRQGVAAEPDFFPAVNWLATMLVDAGQAMDASTTLQDFLTRFPEHPQAKAALAQIQATEGLAVDEGVASMENLRSTHPEVVTAAFLCSLGQGYFKQNKTQQAEVVMEESWKLLKQYDHDTFTWLEKVRAAAVDE